MTDPREVPDTRKKELEDAEWQRFIAALREIEPAAVEILKGCEHRVMLLDEGEEPDPNIDGSGRG